VLQFSGCYLQSFLAWHNIVMSLRAIAVEMLKCNRYMYVEYEYQSVLINSVVSVSVSAVVDGDG